MKSMAINFWAVLVSAILAMVAGGVWYGSLFSRKWMEIVGVKPEDVEARKKMQQSAGPLYAVQFLLTLFQVWVLAYYIQGWKDVSGLSHALMIWAAFVMPTVAGSAMWNNDPKKVAWGRFLIQAGYQLVIFALFGLVLGMWK